MGQRSGCETEANKVMVGLQMGEPGGDEGEGLRPKWRILVDDRQSGKPGVSRARMGWPRGGSGVALVQRVASSGIEFQTGMRCARNGTRRAQGLMVGSLHPQLAHPPDQATPRAPAGCLAEPSFPAPIVASPFEPAHLKPINA